MAATKAIVSRAPLEPRGLNWSLDEVDVYPPGDDEILVEMRATGICHTDIVLSSVPEGIYGVTYPRVVGHEGAGIVRALGSNVSSVQVGDPVILSYNSCSSCRQCKRSHPAYCNSFPQENYVGKRGRMSISGTGEDVFSKFFGQSSFARHSIVSEASVVNVKSLLHNQDELKIFAPLGCGFQTGMGAILNYSSAGPEDAVMILGLGAVGMAALMTAKIQDCKIIIAVDKVESRLQVANDLGATHTINTGSLVVAALKNAVENICPGGVSTVIDTTGVPNLIEESFQCAEKRGKLVFIGVVPRDYEYKFNVSDHMNSGFSITGCIEGDCIPSKV
ncbi:chaperonin 10-like protein [Aspergillus carlsbadensis]|nr:chaperonin 10-like protein [Aspergillus carlsbadensis]